MVIFYVPVPNIPAINTEALSPQVEYIASMVEVIRPLDILSPSTRFCHYDSYVLTVFLQDNWRINDYGHVSCYI